MRLCPEREPESTEIIIWYSINPRGRTAEEGTNVRRKNQPSPSGLQSHKTLHIIRKHTRACISQANSREAFFVSLIDTLLSMPTETLKFSPAWTEPPIINAESRMLLDKSLEFQHKNMSFLIHLYKTGQLPTPPGKTTWILDGKLIDGPPDKIPKGSAVWTEVCSYLQFMLLFTYSMLSVWPFSLYRRLKCH